MAICAVMTTQRHLITNSPSGVLIHFVQEYFIRQTIHRQTNFALRNNSHFALPLRVKPLQHAGGALLSDTLSIPATREVKDTLFYVTPT